MATVEGVGRGAAARSASLRRSTEACAFTVLAGQAGTPEAATPSTPAGMVDLATLLSLQEAETARDRTARRHGQLVLSELVALQHETLRDQVDRSALGRLAVLMESIPVAADPRLSAALAAIHLRARVELARRPD